MSYCVVITAAGDIDEARELAGGIIESGLGACVQISSITSYYMWEGVKEEQQEYRLMIKTRVELYPDLDEFIRANHSYRVPEIIQVPVESGSRDYFNWIDRVTR